MLEGDAATTSPFERARAQGGWEDLVRVLARQLGRRDRVKTDKSRRRALLALVFVGGDDRPGELRLASAHQREERLLERPGGSGRHAIAPWTARARRLDDLRGRSGPAREAVSLVRAALRSRGRRCGVRCGITRWASSFRVLIARRKARKARRSPAAQIRSIRSRNSGGRASTSARRSAKPMSVEEDMPAQSSRPISPDST